MCRATTDPGGPRRCSGDTRAALSRSTESVTVLEAAEQILTSALAGAGVGGGASGFAERSSAPDTGITAASPRTPVSFGDKTTRIEDIRREIDTAIANLNSAEAWSEYLEYASRFHNYSLTNTLLILMQRPDATRVGGLKKLWNPLGRDIIAGQKAIWINAPRFKKKKYITGDPTAPDADEEVMVGFKPVPVFDIAQTHGAPLPERPEISYTRTTGDAPQEMHDELAKQIADHGFTLEYRELPEDGAEGYTDFSAKKVVVSTRWSNAHQAMVAAHELAHIQLEHGKQATDYHQGPGGQRPTMEVEAESVAYVIGRHFGLSPGGSSFGYISGWAHGDPEKVRKTAERVIKASNGILGKLPKPEIPAA